MHETRNSSTTNFLAFAYAELKNLPQCLQASHHIHSMTKVMHLLKMHVYYISTGIIIQKEEKE